jgi:TonB family protein
VSDPWRLTFAGVVLATGLLANSGTFAQAPARRAKVTVQPTYPELARRMHIVGIVKVELTIAPSGAIKETRVIGGNPILVGSVTNALARWKFEPGPGEDKQIMQFSFSGNE